MNWLSGKNAPAVLIVEDDPVAAMLLERMFQKHNVVADKTDNAEEALRLHRSNGYRLIIADWVLPGMSGVELCEEIRKASGEYVYYIVCTSRDQRTDRLCAFEAGVDDFITKPVDREELEARLNVASRLILSRENVERKTVELERAAIRLSDVNRSLEAASRRFEELFNGLPAPCFTFDRLGMIREWNRTASVAFGIDAHAATDVPVWDLFKIKDATFWSRQLVDDLFAGHPIEAFDWTFTRPDGLTRSFEGNLICLRNSLNAPVGAICASIDVTERNATKRRTELFAEQLANQKVELERMNERLGRLAVTDGLTGLWNHRRFQEMLEDTIRFHRDRNLVFSLVLIDVDHFKGINDEFGHQFGDHILRQFADVLKSTTRVGELPARYGGEEFAVLLQGTDRIEASAAAERFLQAIRTQQWRHKPVTASAGVSTFDDDALSAAEIIRQADLALYRSKAFGRDQATHYDDLPIAEQRCA